MDPNVPKIELQANKKKVPKIVLQANKKKDTEDLNDTDAKKHAGCGVIALMESARDDEDVDRFKDKWHKINLNKGVAKDAEFGEQETKLAKLYQDEKLAQALAELYQDEKRAQALAKLYQDEKQTRPLTNFLINVKHKEKLAINWIKDEVRKIVQDVEGWGWRKKENQSQNGGQGGENEAGCKGEKERVPDQKAKDEVEKDSRHVLNVIRNALPAIYPGRTALHMAAANGNVEIVRGICDVGNVDLNKRDVLGYTPLHLACYSTHPKRDEVIKILLASKHIDANVAAKEAGYYFTPLHLAIKAKSTDIVDMLLDWSPVGKNYSKVLDVDTKSTHGWTALHLAIKLKILETDEGKKSDFKAMVVRLIRYMNKHSPEAINTSDETKRTPLHTCVEHKDYELVELLLEDGDKIDPELLDAKGRTSLEIAVHQGDYEMVQKIQRYLERSGLFGDHQAYADSANAILVGAALLATVTFTAWVQIPTNDSTLFWVFISFSFYFAIATFIAAAGAAIPSRGSTLGLVRRAVLASAICLEISLGCAVAAFATAGFLILPPGKPRRKVIATTAIGGFVCFFFLLTFLRKITRALDPIFLWLDYKIQSLIKDHIWKPVTKGIKSRLVKIKGVKDLKEWYKEHVIDPDSTGSSHSKKSEGSSRMGKGSGMTRSTSSMEDGSKPIIIETEA
jgi:ankyrin repeat protein